MLEVPNDEGTFVFTTKVISPVVLQSPIKRAVYVVVCIGLTVNERPVPASDPSAYQCHAAPVPTTALPGTIVSVCVVNGHSGEVPEIEASATDDSVLVLRV